MQQTRFKIEIRLEDGTWTDAAEWLGHGLTQEMNRWDTHCEAATVCEDLAAVGFDPNKLRVVEHGVASYD